uniref:EPCAM/Trop-2 C-terminal domain-containing protein n=1 Tax=Sus scrofa TaxID=9823 RepID=A0A4X1STQ2_PIG
QTPGNHPRQRSRAQRSPQPSPVRSGFALLRPPWPGARPRAAIAVAAAAAPAAGGGDRPRSRAGQLYVPHQQDDHVRKERPGRPLPVPRARLRPAGRLLHAHFQVSAAQGAHERVQERPRAGASERARARGQRRPVRPGLRPAGQLQGAPVQPDVRVLVRELGGRAPHRLGRPEPALRRAGAHPHILIDLRHRPDTRAFNHSDLDAELRRLFRERYLLHPKFVAAVHYEHPTIQIELQQNASQKAAGDVDIADAAYYFERDVKGESVFPGRGGLDVRVRGEPLLLERTLIYYLDEKPPQFSMKRLTSGLIAVIVVVAVALVAGVVVLVVTNRRKSGKYKKVEVKELGEMRKEPSL